MSLLSLQRRLLFALTIALVCPPTWGAPTSGRGGPFIQYHGTSLSGFDAQLEGNVLVVGGKGYGVAAKNFRLGGAGGGGFAWGGSQNLQFGMGWGGVIGEYAPAPWLNAWLVIGGGGYSVGKIILETDTTTTVQKVSSGGFVLFYPGLSVEVKLKNNIVLCGDVGYFLPSQARLHSLTAGVSLMFGKN